MPDTESVGSVRPRTLPECDAGGREDEPFTRIRYETWLAQAIQELFALVYSADDVERGKPVAAIGIENGCVIGRGFSLLETYHELGTRYTSTQRHRDLGRRSLPTASRAGGPQAYRQRLSGARQLRLHVLPLLHEAFDALLERRALYEH